MTRGWWAGWAIGLAVAGVVCIALPGIGFVGGFAVGLVCCFGGGQIGRRWWA